MSTSLLPWGTRRNDLLRALRRRDRDEALRLMALAHRPHWPPHPPLDWAQSHRIHDKIDYGGDGHWAIAEAARHTAENRFEHAICLIERYGGCHCNANSRGPDFMILPNGAIR